MVLTVVISSYCFGLMWHVHLSPGQEGLRHMTQNRKRPFTAIYYFPQIVYQPGHSTPLFFWKPNGAVHPLAEALAKASRVQARVGPPP
jgi:hypothetical protein